MKKSLTKDELLARSEFRHQLRRFERFGEDAARRQGVTFPQYLLLLHIKATPGRSWALIGELAERMLLEHHSMVGLVSRSEAAGLVERRRGTDDKRQVQVFLTREGARAVDAIAAAHDEGLQTLQRYLRAAVSARDRAES